MCQLLGISALKPVSAQFALQGFLQRGGGTGEHCDGWGIGYWPGSRAATVHEAVAAAHSARAEQMRRRGLRSRNFIVHVRKATQGAVNRSNCHPFRRKLWNRTWLFAHNGDLGQDLPGTQGLFSPLGTTDSERAFCLLLEGLAAELTQGNARAPAPPAAQIEAALAGQAARLARHGTFNFLLSDGDHLYAHCSTHLHHVERRYPFPKVELVDYPGVIDLAHHNHTDDRISVIATQPLTRGEPWQAFAPGELRVFRHGRSHHAAAVAGAAVAVAGAAATPVLLTA